MSKTTYLESRAPLVELIRLVITMLIFTNSKGTSEATGYKELSFIHYRYCLPDGYTGLCPSSISKYMHQILVSH